MKRLLVAAAAALLFTCSTVQADDSAPLAPAAIPFYVVQDAPPAPEGAKPAAPAPKAAHPHHAHAHPHPALFHCVRIKDPHHVAPCAVPLVVQVKDPCWNPCDCRCAPKCVSVMICVPPCGCPKITCKKNGAYVKYDYGKYRIEIRSKNGVVEVDYDD